jgi:type I restriction enzyme S subunit
MSDLPSGWKFPRLDKLGEFKNGVNKSKDDFGHGKPLVNLNDIFGKNHLSSSAFLDLVDVNEQEIANYSLIAGDVLFVRSSVKPEGVGLTAVVLEDMPETVYSGFIIRFRNGGKIDKNFARYCFYENRFRHNLMSKSTISANTNINQPALGSMQIPLPPLPEQRAIARILSTWDEAIALVGALIDALTLRKRGLMQVLLTGKVRFSDYVQDNGYKFVIGKDIPNDWQILDFGEFATRSKAKFDPKKSDISLQCVELEHIEPETGQILGTVSTESQKSIKNLFQSGQILFGKLRPYLRKWAQPDFEGACSSEIWVLDANKKSCTNDYLYLIIQTDRFISSANVTSGTKMPRADWNYVTEYAYAIPMPTEQQEIVEVIQNTSIHVETFQAYRAHLQRQKKGLMQVLLTGKVRVEGIADDA